MNEEAEITDVAASAATSTEEIDDQRRGESESQTGRQDEGLEEEKATGSHSEGQKAESQSDGSGAVAMTAAERKLRLASSKAGTHLCNYLRKKFSLSYKAIEKSKPDWYNAKIEAYLSQFSEKLDSRVDELIASFNVRKLLHDLEEINKTPVSDEDEVAWRPTGSPRQDVRAHLFRQNQEYVRSLRAVMRQTKTTSKTKCNRLSALRQSVQARENAIKEMDEWMSAILGQFS